MLPTSIRTDKSPLWIVIFHSPTRVFHVRANDAADAFALARDTETVLELLESGSRNRQLSTTRVDREDP
jgi:hypothetical protein